MNYATRGASGQNILTSTCNYFDKQIYFRQFWHLYRIQLFLKC